MIHPDDALALIQSFRRSPRSEDVPLEKALGRILPAPVKSSIDQPPFDKSAMDGWAWHPAKDERIPETSLSIRGVIAAGKDKVGDLSSGPIRPGEAVRIMTGAAIPDGATRVQRVEWSIETANSVCFNQSEKYDNIIHRADNARAGDEILSPRMLRAQDIAVLAADGRPYVATAVRPVVGVFSTGAELANPGEILSGSKIYDSNRPQIMAQLPEGLCECRDLGQLPDDYDETLAAVIQAISTCDVLVLSGGVSMGDFDFVPKALMAAGVEKRFHGIAMKPGKPTFFGVVASTQTVKNPGKTGESECFVFGLPGNPVSVFVNTELLLIPLLMALCGIEYSPAYLPIPAAEDITRKASDRVEFLPIRVDGKGVRPVRYGGSSAIQALAEADGFLRMEIGIDRIEKGSLSNVRFVR